MPHRGAATPCELAGAAARPRSMRRLLPRVSSGLRATHPPPHPDGRGEGRVCWPASVSPLLTVVVWRSTRRAAGKLGRVCPGCICACAGLLFGTRRSVRRLSSLGTCRRSATDIHPAAHLPRTAFEDLDSRLDAPNLVRRFHGRDRAAVLQSGCAASPSSFSTIDATRRRRLAGRLPGFRT